METAPTKKMGPQMVPQIHLARWPRLGVVKGLGAQVCRSASRASFHCSEARKLGLGTEASNSTLPFSILSWFCAHSGNIIDTIPALL